MRLRVALTALTALAALSARASADRGPSKLERADRRFHEAEALFDAKRVEEACEAFAESQRLDPKLGTLLNLAFCHETQARLALAWAEYTEGAAWAEQKGQKERADFAHGRANELAPRLSRVHLEFAAEHEIATIAIDGEALARARWTSPLFVDPGEHVLRVTAPRKQPLAIGVHVATGPSEQTVQIVAMRDAELPRAPSPVVDDAPASTRRTAGFVVGGVGLVGLGLGAYFGVRTFQQRDASAGHCAGAQCDADGVAALDDAHRSAALSTVGFGVGLTGVVIGAWLILTAKPAPPVRPFVASNSGGVLLEGRF